MSKQKSNLKNNKPEKPLKVFFCPKCRSMNVGYIFRLRNIFGILPMMECRKCGFQMFSGFPAAFIDKNKLKSKKKSK
jgi:RNase P subunit RPR2